MKQLKKLAFALPFLITFTYLVYLTKPVLGSFDSFLALDLASLKPLVLLAAAALLASLFFIVFVTLSQDWKMTFLVTAISSAAPFLVFHSPFNLLLSAGFSISLFFSAAVLDNKLKTYLDFQPGALLSPPARDLATLLVLVISLTYLFSLDSQIKQRGFQLPDSFIDSTLNFYRSVAPDEQLTPRLTDQQKQQLRSLKDNPQLLKQSGYTLKDLRSLEQAADGKTRALPDSIKQNLKDQLQAMIRPYLNFIAPILALLAFLTLTSFIALLALLSPILLWSLFVLLKLTRLVKFETETRPVKKLVV